MHRVPLVLAALLLLASLPAAAQGKMRRFDQVLQQALQNHPAIRGGQAAQTAALANLAGARWQRFPSLSAEVPGSSGESAGVVRLEQPLWAGGGIEAGINAASSRVDAAGAAIGEARLKLALRVIAAYTEALRQTARLAAAQQGLAEHDKLLAMITRRVQQSVSSQTDQRLAQSRQIQAANEVSLTGQALAGALAQLTQLAGEAVVAVSPAGVAVGEPQPGIVFETVLRQALAFSPTLQRLEFDTLAADAEIDQQRAAYKPRLLLRLEKPTGGSNIERSTRLAVVLQAQPGAGLSAKAGADAAVARREGARAARDEAEREVRERFTLDWQEAEASRARLGSADQASATLDEVFASYTRQYVTGRKSWNDVLNAVREATQARYTLEDTRAQALAASLRLAAGTGTLAAYP